MSDRAGGVGTGCEADTVSSTTHLPQSVGYCLLDSFWLKEMEIEDMDDELKTSKVQMRSTETLLEEKGRPV